MKAVYWRPKDVSRSALVLIALMSLFGLFAVEHLLVRVQNPHEPMKRQAAQLAAECFEAIKEARLSRGHAVDPEVDPAESGLIGEAMTPATSVSGVLAAKQCTCNPNFAAVIVDMLIEAGVKRGDYVAVGYTGSFPALNVCVDAALQTMEVKPIGIASAAASQWGANLPDFLWLDMQRLLFDQGFLSFRAVAASIGGVEDRGVGMAKETRETLEAGIRRVGLVPLEIPSFTAGVDQRMKIYREQAGVATIQAFINIGGGTTSVGKSLGKKLVHAGLNTKLSPRAAEVDSVMTRFLLKHGTPVLHLVRVRDLARRYGLPTEPDHMPEVGEDEQVYARVDYNRGLAAMVLTLILLSLYLFTRSDWGFRILQTARNKQPNGGHPEPMV